MSLRGHIKNGVAVLDEPANLPDGTPVRIEIARLDADFWNGQSVEEQARAQGVGPVHDLDRLAGEWPQNASVDDFLALIRRSRG